MAAAGDLLTRRRVGIEVRSTGVSARFATPDPLFVTRTETVGRTAGHTDVSLWFHLVGDRSQPLEIDAGEFREARWFHWRDAPLHRTDPHLSRFLGKLFDEV